MDILTQHRHKFGHGHASCTCPCCISIPILHFCAHAAWVFHIHHPASPSSCCKSNSMLYVYVHVACPCPCCINIDMQHVHGYAAWKWICSIDMDMQHGLGHVAGTSNQIKSKYLFLQQQQRHCIYQLLAPLFIHRYITVHVLGLFFFFFRGGDGMLFRCQRWIPGQGAQCPCLHLGPM